MPPLEKVDWIWFDGKLVPWDQAQVHVLTHSLHYGFAVFEGIRSYQQPNGRGGIFCLEDHLQRLFESAHVCTLPMPFGKEALLQACKAVVAENNLHSGCYLRPLAFMGEGAMGLAARDNPTHIAVAAWKWGAYLGEQAVRDGIRCTISSYRRPRGDAMLAKGKITGQYVNSILAKRAALSAGYDEAILLDAQGYVCEGTGENIFMIKRGEVRTPFLGEAILGGITRQSVLAFLKDEGIPVVPGPFTRDELYCADEVFLTGTAAEITPVREIENRSIGPGKPGPITRRVQELFRGAVRGEIERYRRWITPV